MPSKPQPTHIAIYMHTLYNGGIERVMFHLIEAFLARGIAVDLVLDELIYSPFEPLIPPRTRLLKLGADSLAKRVPKLTKYLRASRPEVLLSAGHLANEVACLAGKLAHSKIRVIVSEHTTMSADIAGCARWNSRRLIPGTTRLLYPLAYARVAVSRGVADDLCRVSGIARDSVRVIYNPVNFADLRKQAAEAVELAHHPWFAVGEPPVILGIGRLEEQKNFALLVRAFARLRLSRAARLMILGVGSQEGRLRSLIAELGLENDVLLAGFVSNPAAYMARAAVFAMSSAWEGMPVALIEALALGVPIVSTDCPSGPAEVLDGGRFGELVAMHDQAGFVAALERQLDGARKPVTPQWLAQFDSECITEAYLQLMSGKTSHG